jgi:hypothetical protein
MMIQINLWWKTFVVLFEYTRKSVCKKRGLTNIIHFVTVITCDHNKFASQVVSTRSSQIGHTITSVQLSRVEPSFIKWLHGLKAVSTGTIGNTEQIIHVVVLLALMVLQSMNLYINAIIPNFKVFKWTNLVEITVVILRITQLLLTKFVHLSLWRFGISRCGVDLKTVYIRQIEYKNIGQNKCSPRFQLINRCKSAVFIVED